ncbi:hypothetical protein [Piscinibacter sakaiensis]|uniref:hypothetical protein n=1 Tax=Piscinibacter sakaiensis TaxID=1547922 RepID=UPI003AAD8569
MLKLYSRFDIRTLCERHECTGCEAGDPASASFWLSRFIGHGEPASSLRLVADDGSESFEISRRSDTDLVDMLAQRIDNGELRICNRLARHEEPMVLTPVRPVPPKEPPPPVSRRRSAPVAAPPPEPTTMPATVDVAAMAAVLTSAAQEGVPFCEICARAQAERERTAA